MIRLAWLFVFLVGLWAPLRAQHYKLYMELHDTNNVHLTEFYEYWLQPFDQPESVGIADSAFGKGAFVHPRWHHSLSLGDPGKRLWVRIWVSNTTKNDRRFILSIHDFMDTATLYSEDDAGFTKVVSDTYWKVASKRVFPARPLCLPFEVPPGEGRVLYLCIDQHNNNLYFPLHIATTVEFLQNEQNFVIDQYWFWLVGFYLFSIVFNLILFSFLRDKIYLWYCLYVIFNTIFLLMEDSLDALILPQWLYSFIWHAGQYSFLLLSAATGIKIMQSFVSQKKRNTFLYRVGSQLFLVSFVFVGMLFVVMNYLPSSPVMKHIHVFKTVRDILIFSNLLFIFVSLVVEFLKKSVIAYLYGITYFFFFFSATMFMINHMGWGSINLLEPNILAWGLFFELLTLTILLTGRFRYVTQQGIRLRLRGAELEREQTQRLIETQETERRRIAEDLHDDVGATLGALQLHVSNLPESGVADDPEMKRYFEKAIYLAGKATADIRSISHDLLPRDFSQLGLFRVLRNRIDELNAVQAIRFVLITTGEESWLKPIYMVTVYRIINELIQNIVRHSQASEATVQVLILEEETQIIIEDNGIGMDNAVDTKGIGLRNIRSRVEFLKGRLTIDSNERGTSFIIDLKTPGNGYNNG